MEDNLIDAKVLSKVLNPTIATYATYVDVHNRHVVCLVANRGGADLKIYTVESEGEMMLYEHGLDGVPKLSLPKGVEFHTINESEELASLKRELRDKFINLWTRHSSHSEYQKKDWKEFESLLMKLGVYPD